jgi:hypothetical protein
VLRNNLLVTFQEPGARFNKTTRDLTGKTLDGKVVSYTSDVLRSARSVKPTAMTPGELELHPQLPVYEVVTTKNLVYLFDSTAAYLEHQDAMFVGTDSWGKHIEIPASTVLYANIEKTDAVGTVFATLGVVVGVFLVIGLIALATKQSCPFVYSFNGEQYVFDAEPLGGAICRGLARTDISRLDHVKPVDGEYRLLVRNEVPETQYIDRMKLLVVDHPENTQVYPDLQGHFYGFTKVQGATSATDEKGMSLMKFLAASDEITWQTHLPSASRAVDDPVRHTLSVTFPKPVGAKKAWLVTNIGTSSWGSNMIRKTVEYRGNTAETWLKSVTPGSQSYVEMYQFIEREEMYHLKTWVKEKDSWKEEAVILGQGPLIFEDRVYPLDVSNAVGDSLVLRFYPPKGFWTFNYVGVSYEEPSLMYTTSVHARVAHDQGGVSIAGSLRELDTSYYAMPEVGDWAKVSFEVPLEPEGTVRSVYLETSGYYELHLAKDRPDQLARLYNIWMHPGQIVKTTMEEFRAWQSEQRAAASQAQPE